MKIQFTVDGPLMGYKQTTSKSIFHPKERARSKAYGAWKEKVRILAAAAGLPLTGMATIEKPPRLSVHVFWKGLPRLDWKNLYGALEDSLWYLPQGDRYVKPGRHSDVTWDSGREEAVVTVEF
jgi:hypothetical protein